MVQSGPYVARNVKFFSHPWFITLTDKKINWYLSNYLPYYITFPTSVAKSPKTLGKGIVANIYCTVLLSNNIFIYWQKEYLI